MKRLFATSILFSLLTSCFGQSSPADPGITVEPQSQTAPAGEIITLTVTASGTAPFSYQWWDSAGAIPDATNAVYILNPAEPTNSDNYFVLVGNSIGSITSSVATVTIGLPPSISVQPVEQTVAAGSSFTLTVTASGTAPFSYQWWDSTGAIPDATNATFTLNQAEPDDSDNYLVLVSNPFGSIASIAAIVTVGLPPSISVQPVGQTVAAGANVILSVTADGTSPLSYQWLDSAGAIQDATNATFILNPAETSESDNYTVLVSNAFGSITSSPAALVVNPASPVFSGLTSSQSIIYGTTSITLSGTLSAGAFNPPDGETVSVTINGATKSTTLAGGSFSLTFNDPSLATDGVSGSPYAITYAYAGDANFNAAPSDTSTSLSVTPATLTYVANPATMTYGSALPALSGIVTGFVGSDNQGNATTGTLVFTAAANSASPVGNYAINGSGLAAVNYTFVQAGSNPTALTVAPAVLAVTADSYSQAYGSTNPVLTAGYDGFVNGDSSSVVSGSPTLSTSVATNTPVGAYPITVANGTLSAANYTFSDVNGTLTVTQAVLTVTADDTNRAYGTANPVFTASFSGLVNGESASDTNILTGAADLESAANATSPIGNYDITAALGTLAATNYSFVFSNATLAVVTAQVTGLVGVSDKTYDGTTNVTITSETLSGVLNGDDVSLTGGTASFGDKNVGTTKPVTVTGLSLGGSQATNYALVSSTVTTNASINPATLTVSATGVDKTYDATATATVTLSDNSLAGDSVTDSYSSASFNDANAGPGKTVNVSGLSISGTDAGNYTLASTTASTTANINPLALTVTAVADTKTYDGTTTSAGTPAFSPALAGSDTPGFSQTFDTPMAGMGKTLTPAGVVNDGNSGSNYSYTYVPIATGEIDPATLTYVANPATMTYGSALPALSGTVTGFVGSDNQGNATTGTLVFTAAANSASPVGNYAINGSGLAAVNYTFVQAGSNPTALTVAPAVLAVTADSYSQAYGSTNPVLTAGYDGFVNGDSSSVVSGSPTLSTSVATNTPVGAYPITVANGTLSAANYTFSDVNGTLTVTQAVLTVTADDTNRAYGTANPVFTASFSGLVNGESASDTNILTGAADLESAANATSPIGNYDITAALGTLAATNYSFVFSNATLAVVTAQVTGLVGVSDKTYDGTTNVTITSETLSGVLNGDDVSLTGGTASFGDKNVAAGKTVTVTGLSLGGSQATNYALVSSTVTTNASINPATLTVSATGVDKTYDATATATVTLSDNSLAGDSVTDSYSSASFNDANAGPGKTVNVSGLSISGTDAGNYTLASTTASTTANINPLALTVTAVADTKTYDGTTTSAGTPAFSPALAGSDTPGFSQTFDTPMAGMGKTLTPAGVVNDGNSGSNYSYTYVPIATGEIDPATPTAVLTVNNSPVTYTGLGQAATVAISSSSVPGSVANISTGGSASQTAVGTYPVVADFVPTDTTNYSPLTGLSAGSFVILPAGSSVTYSTTGPFIYNGMAQSPVISLSGSTGAATTNYVGTNFDGTGYASVNAPTNAGIYYVSNTVAADDSYSGTTNSLTFTIGQQTNALALSSSANPSTNGDTVVFTASVQINGSTLSDATGSVVFSVAGSPVATNALDNGVATYSDNTLAGSAGTAIQSFYTGDNNYQGSTNSLSQVVGLVITASAGANGSLSPSGVTAVAYNGSQSYTFTPNTGYQVADVEVDNVSVGAVSSYSFGSVTANHTITATFAIITYTLNYTTDGNGSISGSPSQTVSYGANGATVTATPDTGYQFDHWSDGYPTASRTDLNVTANFNAEAFFVLACTSPTITGGIDASQQGANLYAGSQLILTLTNAAGTGPLAYQWLTNGVAILDATNASYTNLTVALSDAGDYACAVTNDCGSVTSSVVEVTIYLPPAISVQPVGQTASAGANVILSVTANGTGPLSYQWQLNGTNLLNELITTVAGNGVPAYSGDGEAATNASLNIPFGLAVDALGNFYIADTGNQVVRKVDTNNLISTAAGNGISGSSGDGGAATNASFLYPLDVAIDPSGNLFIADQDNHRVRRVDLNGIITTAVGNGNQGNSGDGGDATNASLSFPHGLAVDSAGNLFIADSGSGFIRKVDTNGIITTVAGNGGQGYSGDGGTATNASLNDPTGVAVDGSGNLFIADSDNNCIRKVAANGIITTVAGNGLQAYSGDGGAATNATLNDPTGVAVDGSGNLYIADSHNSLVRQMNSAGIITTIAGNNQTNQYNFVGGFSGDGGAATNASLFYPYRVVVDTSGNLFIADLDNNRIRQVGLTMEPAITIHNLNTNNAGNYTVIVSNPFGSITGSVATVTIGLPPSISVQPVGQTVAAGVSVNLTVTASGTAPLSYQWWNSTGAILGATNAIYILNPAEPNFSDNYFVVVSNSYGTATSSMAALVVYLPVNITGQPQNQTVSAGTTAILSVTANGTGPLGYQWQFNGTSLPDATSATLVIPDVQLGSLGDYVVVVSNNYSSTQSVTATLTMLPSIISPFTGTTGILGESVTLSVGAEGSGTLTYQWLKNGAQISGANGPTYTIPTLQLTDGGFYSAVITSSYGSVTNAPAQLNVSVNNVIAAQIITQPQNQLVVEGSNATFFVVASGDDLHYQWYGYGGNDANLVDGATNASLTVITDGEGSQVYDLSVVVTNLAGEVASSNASLTVLTVLTGPINPYPPGTLGYDLFQSTFTLASSTNGTASYAPFSSDLGTNSAVWTWPINLSCVGIASDKYHAVLITSNELLTCNHDDGEAGQTVTFHDTNGVSWVGVVTNVINVISDIDISQLSNSAPASIVIPYVLPPDYANYIAGNSLVGMPAFWLHKGAGTIDYAPVAWVAVANLLGYGAYGEWMQLLHNGYGAYSGTSAVDGDSGDPAFMSLSNNPVLLYALDYYPDSGGMFVSGVINWYSLAGLGLTNGLNVLDLSGYPLQSAAPPTPDYNYIVPPTNQWASPGTLVTFDASVCVFNTSPFAYQWQWNGTNLAGATNAILAFPAAAANVGNYSVMVSNELGSVTVGATLALIINQPVQILAPVVTNGQFQFGFNTISNDSYTVQYEDNLASGNWIVLTNFTGSGSYWQTPPLPLVTQRFYRFVTSPP